MFAKCDSHVRKSSAICEQTANAFCVSLAYMGQISEVAARLKELREGAGVSVRDFARRLDMPMGTYKHYEDRFKRRYLPRDFAQSVARELAKEGVDPAEVMALAGGEAFDVIEPGDNAPPGTALIPVYDVAASAGDGAIVEGYEPIAASLALPPDYLRRITKARVEDLSIISVKGDSMLPTLKDDDIVMLDRTKTSTAYDGLFVLRFRDALHVKRLSRGSSPDTVLIISDNPKYKDQEYPADQVTVIGKVIWVGGKV